MRRVSCYETVPGDVTPKSQNPGNIWRREPAETILDLLRAAMPAIRKRLEEEAGRAARELEEKELARRQLKKRQLSLAVAAALGLLFILGAIVFFSNRLGVAREVAEIQKIDRQLHEGNLSSISSDTEANLDRFLTSYRADPTATNSEIVSAIRNLETTFGQTGQQLVAEPLLEPAYGVKIDRYEALALHFDPAVAELWRKTLLPTLAARREFLNDWLENKRPDRRTRTYFLDSEAKRFESLGDRPFSALLAARSTQEKEREVASWQGRIDADADVPSRIATIQNLFNSAVQEQDPEFIHLARIGLAGQFATTVLKRQENSLVREQLLTPLVPDLARSADGQVRFEVLAQDLLNCTSREECEKRLSVVRSVISDANTSAASWRSAADNLLRSLLLDVPAEERRNVWNSIAASMANGYLFSARTDAWPADVGPLHSGIREVAAAARDFTPELIERLSKHPIYTAELDYLADRLGVTEVRRRIVPIYASILYALVQRDVLPSDDLTQVSRQVSSAIADRVDARAPFSGIVGELTQVIGLVQSVNSQRSRGAFVETPASLQLEHLLRDAKQSHCTALVSHEAPTECANAA